MMALVIILVMLFLAVLLTVSYFPRFPKAQFKKKEYHFETGKEQLFKLEEKHWHNEEAKDFSFKTEALEGSPSIKYNIPHRYNEDKIALLVRDPEWLFAYWEIAHGTIEHLEAKHHGLFSHSTPVLRVYNLTESETSSSFLDIELSHDATRCHIHVQKPNNRYYVVIGRKKADGYFVPILYSNVVQTPRASVSHVLDKDWLPALEYAHLLYKDAYPISSFEVTKERND